MKPMTFTQCLDRASQILKHQPNSILYLSVGSFLKKNASLEKIHTQQAPLSILKSGKPAVIILVDPLFHQYDPLYLERLKEYHVKENGTEIVNPEFPHVVFLKCGEFLQDGSASLKKFSQWIQQHPTMELYVGDYTVTQPCLPFHEYPLFSKTLACMPNVWLSKSCTKEHFVNASYTCPIVPSPFVFTPTPQKKKIPQQIKQQQTKTKKKN